MLGFYVDLKAMRTQITISDAPRRLAKVRLPSISELTPYRI